MLILALLTGGLAFASPADHFGFGAVTVGRAGGGWALDGDSSAALGNPALLAGLESSELQLGYSVTRFSFSELPPIYWDTNQDGLADLTVEIAADPPGPMDTHLGPFTKNLPVKELISVAHAGMTMAHLPGVAQASVDQVIAILRAASRVP